MVTLTTWHCSLMAGFSSRVGSPNSTAWTAPVGPAAAGWLLGPQLSSAIAWSEFGYPPVSGLVLQSDGKMLVSGWLALAPQVYQMTLLRLHATDRWTRVSIATNSLSEVSLAVQADGKVLLGSMGQLVRLNVDGTQDAGFLAGLLPDSSYSSSIYRLALQATVEFFANGGFAAFDGISPAGLVRLNNDPDLAAGELEMVSADFSVIEAATQIVLTARRVAGSRGTVVVNYGAIPGTATAGADYLPLSGN